MTEWRAVLEEVVRERRPALVGYASLLTHDLRDAEDLVHDAIVRTFSAERPVTNVHTAEAYIRRVVRTTFLDSARKRRTWQSRSSLFATDDVERSPESAAVAGFDVRQALETLSPRERACIVLRHFDDLTIADIAHDLNLSVGAVKRYLSDGNAKLRRVLGADVLPETSAPVRSVPSVVIDRYPGRSAS